MNRAGNVQIYQIFYKYVSAKAARKEKLFTGLKNYLSRFSGCLFVAVPYKTLIFASFGAKWYNKVNNY